MNHNFHSFQLIKIILKICKEKKRKCYIFLIVLQETNYFSLDLASASISVLLQHWKQICFLIQNIAK